MRFVELPADVLLFVSTFVDLRAVRSANRWLRSRVAGHHLPVRLRVSVARVTAGQLDWFVRHHAREARHVELYYRVPVLADARAGAVPSVRSDATGRSILDALGC